MNEKTLRLILGDQLNEQHSWFSEVDPQVTYVLMEVGTETDYVRHHVQKVVAFFLAMRGFRDRLRDLGHEVIYLEFDDPANAHNFPDNLSRIICEGKFSGWAFQLPDEYRLDRILHDFAATAGLPVEVADTEHFFTTRDDLPAFFKGKKTYLLEYFYRDLRKKENILMEGKDPVTGQWNYDGDNRNKYRGKDPIPPLPGIAHDARPIMDLLTAKGVKTIGNLPEATLRWPVTRREGLMLLEHFVEHLLPWFGKYQDALFTDDPFLFHSRLSFAMNVKLISPREVIDAVIEKWKTDPERNDIAQVEGFVRQILGWREYMRGIYWAKMPDYATMNYFEHRADLPAWFWSGDTKMSCMSHAIRQSLDHAYAHHIQRLMVTGNFALLLGVDPDQLDEWYLGIYIDAIEWVEITNTRGMSQFADGGIVGSKPYVSSGNYMNKMGNYCAKCHYNQKLKSGEGSCPFNSLYWDFYERHRDKLARNPRIGMAYRTWDRMAEDKRAALLQTAAHYKANAAQL
ncbi:MAG: cryptochrome/photolyase family protein [Bacteroidota bacterium]